MGNSMAKRRKPKWFLDMLGELSGETLRIMRLYEPELDLMKQVGIPNNALRKCFENIRNMIIFDVGNSRYSEPIPNESCQYALLQHVLASNETGFSTGDFTYLFGNDIEKIYAWTHTKNKASCLISHVNPSVRSQDLWITLASVFELANALITDWTGMVDMDMHWIWDYSPTKSIKQLLAVQPKDFDVHHVGSEDTFQKGTLLSIRDIYDRIPLANALFSDKRLYSASRLLFASYSSNYPANEPENMRAVRVPEYEPWETCKQFASVDSAIVQATRAVESLIGQPSSSVRRCKEHWIADLDLDPCSEFQDGISYLDFWMKYLFDIRNSAAHAGKPGYLLSRRLKMAQVQEYANHLINSYIEKHSESIPADVTDPGIAIHFNEELVKRLPEGIDEGSSTCITADSDCFPARYRSLHKRVEKSKSPGNS